MASPGSFSVIIVGGGIGGLTMALSIAHHVPGLKQITVYEQAPQYGEIGAGIGIGVNAGRILKRLGVYDDANAISGNRNGVHRQLRRWDTGEEIVTVRAMDETEDGVRQLSVHRAELLDVLLAKIKATGCAQLVTNKRAVEVVDSSDTQATVRFADGSSASANLIVAADGIHSALRQQLAKGIDTPVHYSGRIAYRGLLPLSAVADDWPYDSYAVSWLGRDKHFLVFPISQNKTLNVVAFVTKPEAELGDLRESWSSTAPRSDLEAAFAGWEPTVQRIIRAMGPNPSKWKLNDRDLLGQWVYMGGKVVLAGDAAHAMLPHQGAFFSA
jgi:salicylate hydroxylase